MLDCIPLPVLYLAKNKRMEVKQLAALILFGLMYIQICPRVYGLLLTFPSDTVISIVRLYMVTDLYNVKTDFTCTCFHPNPQISPIISNILLSQG